MKIKVKQIDRFKFNIEARSHSVVSDQPTENGGEDAAMTPPELMLASLGACAEFYAVQYLQARKLDDRGVEVTVTAEKLMQPGAAGKFSHSCNLPGRIERGADGRIAALRASLPDSQHAVVRAERRDRAGGRRAQPAVTRRAAATQLPQFVLNGLAAHSIPKMKCPAFESAGHFRVRLPNQRRSRS